MVGVAGGVVSGGGAGGPGGAGWCFGPGCLDPPPLLWRDGPWCGPPLCPVMTGWEYAGAWAEMPLTPGPMFTATATRSAFPRGPIAGLWVGEPDPFEPTTDVDPPPIPYRPVKFGTAGAGLVLPKPSKLIELSQKKRWSCSEGSRQWWPGCSSPCSVHLRWGCGSSRTSTPGDVTTLTSTCPPPSRRQVPSQARRPPRLSPPWRPDSALPPRRRLPPRQAPGLLLCSVASEIELVETSRHGVDVSWLRDALQRLDPTVLEVEGGPLAKVPGEVGKQHLPALGQCHDASGLMDGHPTQTAGNHLHFTGVHPDAHRDPQLRNGCADVDRRVQRARRTVERQEETVTGGVDLLPAVALDDFTDRHVVLVDQPVPRDVADARQPVR